MSAVLVLLSSSLSDMGAMSGSVCGRLTERTVVVATLGLGTFHLFFCAFHFHHSLSLYVHFTGDFTGDSRVICS